MCAEHTNAIIVDLEDFFFGTCPFVVFEKKWICAHWRRSDL